MPRMTKWVLAVALPVAMAIGCGTWFFPPAPIEPEVTPEAYVIGDLDGVAADKIQDSLDLTPHTGTESDAPILIGADAVGGLSVTQQAAIKSAHDAGWSIVLVNVGVAEIAALHQILSYADTPYDLPDAVSHAEVYALDVEPDGSVWQASWFPPATTAMSRTETRDIDLISGATVTSQTDPVQVALGPDTDEDRNSRMAGFAKWLADDGKRMDSSIAQAAKRQATAQGAGSNNLPDLASAFVNQTYFQYEGDNFGISHFVYSCHSLDNGDDWFFVQQFCVLNGANAYKTNETMKKGQYMGAIKTIANMHAYIGDGNAVGLIQSSPPTVNQVTSVTSGVSFQVGGTVSFNTGGPNAGVSAGITINSSKTVDVQDVTTVNQAGENVNDVRWQYNFRLSDVGTIADCFFQNCITNPPELAISSFQPVNQWIWRMAPEVRNGSRVMGVLFEADLVTTQEDWKVFSITIDDYYADRAWVYYITLPFPPTKGPSSS
ncbi:MAG: hypothetical protein JXQ73_05435 [Phycisphaerae bacterium]|nr:hypothetical protein [Phycisphaerae bacterium]